MFGGSEWLFSADAPPIPGLECSGEVGPSYRELPMSQAPQAHRVMAAGEHIGKILLRPT